MSKAEANHLWNFSEWWSAVWCFYSGAWIYTVCIYIYLRPMSLWCAFLLIYV